METSTPTFDQLPHVVGGLSEKLDRVLELLEKAGFTGHSKQSKPSRRLVYAKEACQIIGKSLSSLYRGIKAPNDPIPSFDAAANSSIFMRMNCTHGLRTDANIPSPLPSPKLRLPSPPA